MREARLWCARRGCGLLASRRPNEVGVISGLDRFDEPIKKWDAGVTACIPLLFDSGGRICPTPLRPTATASSRSRRSPGEGGNLRPPGYEPYESDSRQTAFTDGLPLEISRFRGDVQIQCRRCIMCTVSTKSSQFRHSQFDLLWT